MPQSSHTSSHARTLGDGQPLDPKDTWATIQSGYDVTKLYTRSTDGHGHYEQVIAKLSPGLQAAIHSAIEHVPAYRSMQDFIRDACAHRCVEVDRWLKDPDHVNLQPIDTEVRMAELEDLNAKWTYWKQLIDLLDTSLEQCCRDGDFGTAQVLIDDACTIDSMTTPYLLRLGEVIDRYTDRIRRALS